MMDDSIHIPLIEDDPAHAELIKRAFENRGDRARLTIAHTLEKARAQMKRLRPSLIIADWRLPDGAAAPYLPKIIIHPRRLSSSRPVMEVNATQWRPSRLARERRHTEAEKEIVEKFLPLIITR